MTDRARTGPSLGPNYDIEREIGAGGMATVYLALDVKHQRKVAVKVLRAELSASLGAERFLREIRVAAQLQHPHILPVLDSGAADGVLYYVMPFVEGQSLRERLAGGDLPVHETVRILVQVADALAHAHKCGVIHRDIKPDNVMLSGRHALVADFGVAKAVSESTGQHQLTSIGIALGTPAYMAPEQATADPGIDQRVDIYALGAMAYELLTGRPPFAGTPQEILAAHVTVAPKPVSVIRPSISPTLNEIVMRCLEKRPADRWPSADELLTHLEGLTTPSGGTAPIGARSAISRARRSSVWIGGAAIAGLALAAFLWSDLLKSDATSLALIAPVQLTANPIEQSVIGAAISPDGNYLAYVDPRGLHLQTLKTRETHSVEIGGALRPLRVSWFPDGSRMAFTASDQAGQSALWSVGLFGGRATKLRDHVLTAEVSPKGNFIAFIPGLSGSIQSLREVWIMGPQGQDARMLARADSGESFWTLAWHPDSRSVAVGVWSASSMQIKLLSLDETSTLGKHRVLLDDPMLFQNWTGVLPSAWCADGRFVYVRRDGPGHQATSNVWIVDTDAAQGVTRGIPRRLTQWSAANVRELSADAACSKVVVLQVRNQADVFVGVLDERGRAFREVRKQTFDLRDEFPGAWSPDGKRLLIESARAGDFDVYVRHPTASADELEVAYRAAGGQENAEFVPSGQSIMFLQDGDIFTASLDGGGAQTLVSGDFGQLRCPIRGHYCIAGRAAGKSYIFSRVDPVRGEDREIARAAHRIPFTKWDLSPDGNQVAIVHNDDNTITVLNLSTRSERVVAVRGWQGFEFVAWTTTGDGFYINAGPHAHPTIQRYFAST